MVQTGPLGTAVDRVNENVYVSGIMVMIAVVTLWRTHRKDGELWNLEKSKKKKIQVVRIPITEPHIPGITPFQQLLPCSSIYCLCDDLLRV